MSDKEKPYLTTNKNVVDVNSTTEIRGLGDAIKRLIEVQAQLMNRWGDPTAMNIAETEMLLQALNQYELVITFDCDIDGDGDIDQDDMEVDLIKKSAKTKMKKGVSCCRIQPSKTNTNADTQTDPLGSISTDSSDNTTTPKPRGSSRRRRG